MARTDWVALVTDPAAEYLARTELERFDLRPYLPQIRKRWRSPHGTALMRRYPLFPRYILLPIRESSVPAVRICRGVRRIKPILADAEGRPWRCAETVIDAVREDEAAGAYDEHIIQGDTVKLANGVLKGVAAVLVRNGSNCRAEVLLPLFGGVKAFVPQGQVARL
jgi:transcription antitermination factor NusG